MSCQSSNGLQIGGGPVTTFSSISYVAENRCTRIEPNQDLKEVYPLLGCALSTSHGAIHRESMVCKGERILIIGLGGLGTALGFWLSMINDIEVVVLDLHPEKKEFADEFELSFHSDRSKLDVGEPFDQIFETTGVIGNVELAFDLVGKGGTINLIGQVPHSRDVRFKNFLKMYDGVKIISSSGGLFSPDEDLGILHAKLVNNLESAKRLVSSVIRLDQINEGFQMMKAPTSRRIIIDFQG